MSQRSGRTVLALLALACSVVLSLVSGDARAVGFALRFHGNGVGDIDRVKIPIDPARPADIGAADFTLEFWVKANLGENTAGACTPGGDNWIFGNILIDRDVFGAGDWGDYGVSLGAGRIAFGVGTGSSGTTICGGTLVANGAWHHVAATRRRSDGLLRVFVDGVLDAEADGPDGDVSYRDGRPTAYPNSDPYLVIGAEKHDASPAYPSYSGWIDEVRLSNTLRYTSNFTRPSQPFTADSSTVALYHLDEGSGNLVNDTSGAAGGPSNGTRMYGTGGSRPPGPDWTAEAAPFAQPSIALALVASGLSSPVAITHADDGSGRLFITLQAGRIVIYDGTQVLATPFLDISSLVRCCGEEGLLSAAFHPSYASNGYFFVYYTNTPGNIVIARYRVSADPNLADPGSGVILLTIPHPVNTNHNGGQLQFGLNGYLYIGTGDGGSGNDPPCNAQRDNVLLGKMLRIDVNQNVNTPPYYGIPPTNPYIGPGDPLDEIWAKGLRNPWRFSFDRATGDVFIGDVGQNAREEVDFQPAASPGGENYGWKMMEGTICGGGGTSGCPLGTPPCNDPSLKLPILEYVNPTLGCSITGGYRYRGTQFPEFVGIYFYGDYCSGRIWGGTQDGMGNWTTTELLDTSFFISSFGEDQFGEVYVAHHGGAIYRIVSATNNPFPTITGLGPGSAVAGDSGLTLTVSGTGFISGSVVRWNGADRPTTFVSGTQLTASVSAADLATAGTAAVTVFNPAPGGGSSASRAFYVLHFTDVSLSYWAWQYIEAIANAGITSGCGPRLFCPDAAVARNQMAVFLLRARFGSGYVPPPATGIFGDVPPDDPFARFIEDLYNRGITSGCSVSPRLYCPGSSVTRAQMAVLLLRTREGSGYTPPPATGMFGDVPPANPFAAWIEELARRGITSGCGGGNYCPELDVSRAQMAVFITRTFNLPLP